MVEQRPDGSFPSSPDLLGLIRPLLIRSAVVGVICRPSWDDFARDLYTMRQSG